MTEPTPENGYWQASDGHWYPPHLHPGPTPPPSPSTAPAPKYSQQELRRRNRKWLIGIGVVLLAVGGCAAAIAIDSRKIPGEAQQYCQAFIEDNLKVPSTGTFSKFNVYSQEENRWTVLGLVDAQNTFGDQVRNSFRCELKRNSGGGFELMDLMTEPDSPGGYMVLEGEIPDEAVCRETGSGCTPRPTEAQAKAIEAGVASIYPGVPDGKATDWAVSTCSDIREGLPDESLVRRVVSRYAGGTRPDPTETQAAAILDVIRSAGFCQ